MNADNPHSAKWAPRYLVQKAPGVGGPPIPEDEPCLVIRAQDVLAPMMMKHYRQLYEQLERPDTQVVADMAAHQLALTLWRAANAAKIKQADR